MATNTFFMSIRQILRDNRWKWQSCTNEGSLFPSKLFHHLQSFPFLVLSRLNEKIFWAFIRSNKTSGCQFKGIQGDLVAVFSFHICFITIFCNYHAGRLSLATVRRKLTFSYFFLMRETQSFVFFWRTTELIRNLKITKIEECKIFCKTWYTFSYLYQQNNWKLASAILLKTPRSPNFWWNSVEFMKGLTCKSKNANSGNGEIKIFHLDFEFSRFSARFLDFTPPP